MTTPREGDVEPRPTDETQRAMRRYCDARQAHLVMGHLATHEGRAFVIDVGVFDQTTMSWIRTPRYQPLSRAKPSVGIEDMA